MCFTYSLVQGTHALANLLVHGPFCNGTDGFPLQNVVVADWFEMFEWSKMVYNYLQLPPLTAISQQFANGCMKLWIADHLQVRGTCRLGTFWLNDTITHWLIGSIDCSFCYCPICCMTSLSSLSLRWNAKNRRSSNFGISPPTWYKVRHVCHPIIERIYIYIYT